MRKIAWLAVVAVVVIGAVGYGMLHVLDGSGTPARASTGAPATAPQSAKSGAATTTTALRVGGLTRKVTVIKPKAALPKSAPVIVMLQGVGSTVAQEITRDQLAPYAAAGKAEVVYPWAMGESWNAGGCCGYAYKHQLNDQAFIKAVVAKVNPKHARKIYVVGYSNGARMAYRIACDDPALFDAYAAVKGVPTSGCALKKPVSIIQVASTDDPEIPYRPGDKGLEPLPVTTLMNQVQKEDQCPGTSARTSTQDLTLTTWACANGTRLAFAVWNTGVHSYPRPPASQPAASAVIWSFFTKTKLAPLPA